MLTRERVEKRSLFSPHRTGVKVRESTTPLTVFDKSSLMVWRCISFDVLVNRTGKAAYQIKEISQEIENTFRTKFMT